MKKEENLNKDHDFEKLQKRFTKNLKKILIKNNLKYSSALNDKLSNSHWHLLYTGKGNPTLKTLLTLSKILNSSINDFFIEEGEEENEK